MKFVLTVCLTIVALLSADAGPRKPNIVGQEKLSMNEDASFTILLTHLKVVDPDNWFYPYGFTLTVYEGKNYTVNGHIITPTLNFNGTLKVTVTVNDGYSDSNKYDVEITVNPVNDPPLITNQVPLSTNDITPLTLKFNDLTVTDPDNTYPNGFTMVVSPGSNYTVSGTTITPAAGFSGTLNVPVTVNDGAASSPPYTVKITVVPSNKRPVITGQSTLSTAKNGTIAIEFSHLQVEDPDNVYPNDFTLIIFAGANYTFSGNKVTPASGFTGILIVNVGVNDGNSTSEIFKLQILVKDELTITGQENLETNEDEPVAITIGHLKVYDPNNQFPAGYSIKITPGELYTANGNEILPARNYFGTLTVGVSVTNGTITSSVYNFKVVVKPVNDPPEIVDFPANPLRYNIGNGPVNIFSNIKIIDPDDTHLVLAEVGFRSEGYQAGNEVLALENDETIRGVFDSEQGILTLIGQATLEQYEEVFKKITYNYTNIEDPLPQNKVLFVKLNDGKDVSVIYEKEIQVGEDFEIDIPSVFSPNEDTSNDTWRVRPMRESERYNNSIIRVFNPRGVLVFETFGFREEWDGRHKGEPLPSGTYLYMIDLNLNYATKKITGAVTILR